MPMHTNMNTQPDLGLEDEDESHIDKGQPQVEPGDLHNESRELPYCADEPEAAT